MSGGSFDYLCRSWDLEDLWPRRHQLPRMSRFLAENDMPDAAKETVALELELKALDARVQAHLDRLRDLWKWAEWWDSGDSSEETFKEAYVRYTRGEISP